MAINPNQRAKVIVTVDGQEAKNVMDALQKSADSLKNSMVLSHFWWRFSIK